MHLIIINIINININIIIIVVVVVVRIVQSIRKRPPAPHPTHPRLLSV